MGRRGPAPKPTRLRVLEGNRSHRPLPVGEPKPRPFLPRPPAYLRGEARTYFQQQARRLYDLRMLTELDVQTLVMAAKLWQRWLQAEESVERSLQASSRLIRSKVLIAAKYAGLYSRLASEFGMSPASRVRLATGHEDPNDDPLGILS
jgi:P27 family predicted phage terminase small subunit